MYVLNYNISINFIIVQTTLSVYCLLNFIQAINLEYSHLFKSK